MCDPFFMLILLENLGPGFVVWDKQASIRFRKPGIGEVTARFTVEAERIEEIREEALRAGKAEPTFSVQVMDGQGDVVAEVDQSIHVRPRISSSAV
jgi:hypothetical protein